MVFAGVGWAKPVSTDPATSKPEAGHGPHGAGRPGGEPHPGLPCDGGLEAALLLGARQRCDDFLALFVQYLVYLDVSLAVFNLIPVPPLDGSRILLAVLPERIYFGMMKYERVILIVLLAAVWGGFLDGPLSVMNNVVWDLLDNGTQYIDTIAYSAYYASVGALI